MDYRHTIITKSTWKCIGRPKLINTKVNIFHSRTGQRIPIKGKIKVPIVANGEKGVIPIYVGKEAATLSFPLFMGTSGQTTDFRLNSLFIDEKT
jgi:hypothetical protein